MKYWWGNKKEGKKSETSLIEKLQNTISLKHLILHKMGHLETITAIFSLSWIYLKVLLSGRWQRKKYWNVQHGHFLTYLLKHRDSLKNWHIPWLQLRDWSSPRMSILYGHPNERARASKQTSLHQWEITSQFHISGWKGRMGKTTLGYWNWGHTKIPLLVLFSGQT